MRAVLLVDESVFDPDDPNFLWEPARPWEAEFSVSHAMRKLGHEVTGIPATMDIVETIQKIEAANPHFVFNLVEEIEDHREYDGLFVRILELRGIPYTGASSDALTLSRNKHLAKLAVADAGVLVPRSIIISEGQKFTLGSLGFPVIVKPLHRDGSEGITAKSYVKNPAALRQRIVQLKKLSQHGVLCEEYVPGREIIVTISGTRVVTLDSICELVFPETSRIKFATAQAKFNEGYRTRVGIFYKTPAQLDSRMKQKITDAAKKAYQALKIEAYGKIEFRIDAEKVVFIEANPNSQLSRFAHSTDFASIGYERFIKKIIRMAFDRRRQ